MKKNGLTRCQTELLDFLGSDYTTRRIDLEDCVYRDFGDYDVEVSGGHTQRSRFHIFVWQRKPCLAIVERHLDIPHNIGRVSHLLEDIALRYNGRTAEA